MLSFRMFSLRGLTLTSLSTPTKNFFKVLGIVGKYVGLKLLISLVIIVVGIDAFVGFFVIVVVFIVVVIIVLIHIDAFPI